MFLVTQAPNGRCTLKNSSSPQIPNLNSKSLFSKKKPKIISRNPRKPLNLTLIANATADSSSSSSTKPTDSSSSPSTSTSPSNETIFVGDDRLPLEGVIQFDKPSFSVQLNKWGRVAMLSGGDVLALLLFSAIGRFSHGFPVFDIETLHTADPFIAGWFLSAYFLGGYAVELILDKLVGEVNVEEGNDFDPRAKVRLIVPNSSCGCIIGKGGATIRKTYVGNISLFTDMEEKLHQGHNIVLVSNHQTEADPAVIALLLETTNPYFAENVTYIAGDRVVTDPLCKPFSMGRNLICVYSKKHMNDIPGLAEMKRRANTRSLKEMAMLLRGGSQIIWIAPSGGRDRPDPSTGEWFPAPFDASAVDNIRRLANHSGVPGHLYPLALMCHDIMPPPQQVEKEIGEKRVISFHGVGISAAPEIDFNEIASAHENPEEIKSKFSSALFKSVSEQYDVLKSAIYGNQGHKASTPTISLSQPWL